MVAMFGPPMKSIYDLCRRAKFSWNQCSSFDNMQVLMFGKLSLNAY